jgi:phytanoyl-CoA hydroxylase
MKTDVTQQQITQYQDQGFLVVEDFLPVTELAELKEGVLTALDTMKKTLGDNQMVAGGGAKMERPADDYNSKVFLQRLNLWRLNDVVKKYMLSQALGKMVAQLAGVNKMRVWHDQALFKMPYGNATSWHLDNPYWSFYSRQSISIWIALEDATFQNGCMCFIPGTHKTADWNKNVHIGKNMDELFNVYPEWKKIPTSFAPMKAGTCSFHNGLVAHGAGANMTNGSRMAMTCAYMPEGSAFNGQQNVLSDDYFKSLSVGDVLENDDWNPLVGITT